MVNLLQLAQSTTSGAPIGRTPQEMFGAKPSPILRLMDRPEYGPVVKRLKGAGYNDLQIEGELQREQNRSLDIQEGLGVRTGRPALPAPIKPGPQPLGYSDDKSGRQQTDERLSAERLRRAGFRQPSDYGDLSAFGGEGPYVPKGRTPQQVFGKDAAEAITPGEAWDWLKQQPGIDIEDIYDLQERLFGVTTRPSPGGAQPNSVPSGVVAGAPPTLGRKPAMPGVTQNVDVAVPPVPPQAYSQPFPPGMNDPDLAAFAQGLEAGPNTKGPMGETMDLAGVSPAAGGAPAPAAPAGADKGFLGMSPDFYRGLMDFGLATMVAGGRPGATTLGALGEGGQAALAGVDKRKLQKAGASLEARKQAREDRETDLEARRTRVAEANQKLEDIKSKKKELLSTTVDRDGNLVGITKDGETVKLGIKAEGMTVKEMATLAAKMAETEQFDPATFQTTTNVDPQRFQAAMETLSRLSKGQQQGDMPRPASKAEYDALPSGTRFLDPQGQMRTKP